MMRLFTKTLLQKKKESVKKKIIVNHHHIEEQKELIFVFVQRTYGSEKERRPPDGIQKKVRGIASVFRAQKNTKERRQ